MNETDKARADQIRARADAEFAASLVESTCPNGKHGSWYCECEYTHTCGWCERDEALDRLAAATERADKPEAAMLLNVFYVINEAFSNCDLYAADAEHHPSAWALREEIAEGLRALADDPGTPRARGAADPVSEETRRDRKHA